MTVLHAGGKFDNDAYKVSAACMGLAASGNALSESLELSIHKNNQVHYQKYNLGVPKNP